MELTDLELYWTRKHKGLASERETEEYIRSLEKKVDNLEKIEQEHQKENGELREIVKELEEENTKQRKQLNSAFDKGFIHKDKIREKMKEYKWAIESYDCSIADYKQSQAVGSWNILRKLLEERN